MTNDLISTGESLPHSSSRRVLLATTLAAGVGSLLPMTSLHATPDDAIRPVQPRRPGEGVTRTGLVRQDLSVPGREIIQVRVDLAPGVAFPAHSHPGEEVAFVIEGELEYRLEGGPAVRLKAGEALFIPAGVAHTARNVGTVNAAELATYIVEKGKPLVAFSPVAASAK